MSASMTEKTQGDEVVPCILAELTSFSNVMDVQFFRRTAVLTPVSISSKYLLAQNVIFF